MRCKNCKEKFEVIHFNQKYCFKEECKKVWIEKAALEQWSETKKELKPKTNSKTFKASLQEEVNRLSKMIDERFKHLCIDCGSDYGKQKDASHFHNVGGNENLRYNLHNVHTSRAYCNQYGRGRKPEYYDGLILRYGQEYADYVKYELPKLYPYLGLKAPDYPEKLKTVRKIIREFETFKFKDSRTLRTQLNNLIGIYSENK